MIVFARTKLSNKKQLISGLADIFGIGPSLALKISKVVGLSSAMRIGGLSEEKQFLISRLLSQWKLLTSTYLEKKLNEDIGYLRQIKSYRGLRHRLCLPVRGQRTHTNAKTVKRVRKFHIFSTNDKEFGKKAKA